eukprot:5439269-Pleurochrysis_carterae.AAC.1
MARTPTVATVRACESESNSDGRAPKTMGRARDSDVARRAVRARGIDGHVHRRSELVEMVSHHSVSERRAGT